MTLSKSQYIRALQCPKMLWMDKFMPDKAADTNLDSIFKTGNEVGDLARSYFGNYALVDFSFDKKHMIADTEKFIEDDAENIAEASFMFDDLFCSVDILHKNQNGWDIIEVKSSTHTTDVYINDMAFQYYVLSNAGLNITSVCNMHLNSDYVRYGDLELDKLFTIEDYTSTVLSRQEQVKSNIDHIRKYMETAHHSEPECDISICCDDPYECIYKAYCSRHLPEQSIFNIHGLTKKKKYEYYHNGIVTFEDIINCKPKLSEKQIQQVETAYYHNEPTIDKEKIKECIEEFTYPLYFLDFETYQQAVPKYDGIYPYMQVPFQYSLHALQSKDAKLEHYEFLGREGTDPRRLLAEQLCKDIPLDVCTLAYNMRFEKMVIKSLAETYPDLAEHLMNIHDNMKDLMIPFQKQYYYSEALEGSYSIKYVLPAMCPNDPELDYHSLDGIHNGGEAMTAFADLPNHTPEEIATIRKNLLAYCRLDTLAMVKVLEKLYDMC